LRQHQVEFKESIRRYTSQATPNPLDQKSLREYRIARLENQTRFWSRFGVTQSRGSRFELGMEIPAPVSILLKLYLNGIIDDRDLRSVNADSALMD
jgi:hypothetical protein